LYKQIVELGEQLAVAERIARDKDEHIGQHTSLYIRWKLP
jgi:hypothetical protein